MDLPISLGLRLASADEGSRLPAIQRPCFFKRALTKVPDAILRPRNLQRGGQKRKKDLYNASLDSGNAENCPASSELILRALSRNIFQISRQLLNFIWCHGLASYSSRRIGPWPSIPALSSSTGPKPWFLIHAIMANCGRESCSSSSPRSWYTFRTSLRLGKRKSSKIRSLRSLDKSPVWVWSSCNDRHCCCPINILAIQGKKSWKKPHCEMPCYQPCRQSTNTRSNKNRISKESSRFKIQAGTGLHSGCSATIKFPSTRT